MYPLMYLNIKICYIPVGCVQFLLDRVDTVKQEIVHASLERSRVDTDLHWPVVLDVSDPVFLVEKYLPGLQQHLDFPFPPDTLIPHLTSGRENVFFFEPPEVVFVVVARHTFSSSSNKHPISDLPKAWTDLA